MKIYKFLLMAILLNLLPTFNFTVQQPSGLMNMLLGRNSKRYICNRCAQGFNKERLLLAHLLYQHGVNANYWCHLCQKAFATLTERNRCLEWHLQTGIRRHQKRRMNWQRRQRTF